MKLLASLLALVPLAAAAQADFPSRPIKLVSPFPPGGATDVTARLLAGKMTENLKQPVVVDYKPGAGATLGTDLAAKSAPDGYTILMSSFPSISTGPLINKNVRYDPLKDFTHLVMIGTFPNGVIVNVASPFTSFNDLMSHAKANPGKLTYSSAGPASSGHLTGELLKQILKIDMLHIPHKGTGPALIDLLGGNIDLLFDGLVSAANQVKGGKVRLLAVTSGERLPNYPDTPALGELVPGAVGVSWFGVSGPANLPKPVAEKLEAEVSRALAAPDVRDRLRDVGMTVTGLRSDVFVAFIQKDIAHWAPVVKAAKLDQQ